MADDPERPEPAPPVAPAAAYVPNVDIQAPANVIIQEGNYDIPGIIHGPAIPLFEDDD